MKSTMPAALPAKAAARVYNPGEHALGLKINGQVFDGPTFTLVL